MSLHVTRLLCQRLIGVGLLCVPSILIGTAAVARAADHGDTPFLQATGRHDARLTDFFAFVRNGNLVLAVCLDPTIPPDVTNYLFASDLTIKIFIDRDSLVTFRNANDLATFGGTIVSPGSIQEDIVFEVTFDQQGSPVLVTQGLSPSAQQQVSLFTGLRDDPFIRGPRLGRNIAAIVLQLPLAEVRSGQDTILAWATSKVDGLTGPFQDMAGRALRSQFPENDQMNMLHPRDHFNVLGVTPDVIIFDTLRPAGFPNGLELNDDVLDLVGDPRPLSNDDPFPTQNDLPFLNQMPYLASPHVEGTIPTVSEWGMVILALSLLVLSKVYLNRRCRKPA